jgi:hypothetical protein
MDRRDLISYELGHHSDEMAIGEVSLVRIVELAVLGAALSLMAGCVSPEEQRAADQQTCAGYGFTPGTDAFAHCMMTTAQQRDAQAAADRRAADARDAADKQAQAARDQADQDAWDKRTGQGKYSSSSSSPSSTTAPDLSSMNCTTTSNSSGSPNDMTSSSKTVCHN